MDRPTPSPTISRGLLVAARLCVATVVGRSLKELGDSFDDYYMRLIKDRRWSGTTWPEKTTSSKFSGAVFNFQRSASAPVICSDTDYAVDDLYAILSQRLMILWHIVVAALIMHHNR